MQCNTNYKNKKLIDNWFIKRNIFSPAFTHCKPNG